MDTKTIKETPLHLNTGGSSTPRVSSEDSFDLVSSSNVSGDEMCRKAKDEDEDEDEDDGGDSDWE